LSGRNVWFWPPKLKLNSETSLGSLMFEMSMIVPPRANQAAYILSPWTIGWCIWVPGNMSMGHHGVSPAATCWPVRQNLDTSLGFLGSERSTFTLMPPKKPGISAAM